MKRQQEIDRVYELVKNKYEAKVFQFSDVWKSLVKEDKLSKQEQTTLMGSLYTDLLQDARFLYVGNQK
ncbi:hypothetical protein FACS1894166_09520 [Bacilli bacterium]|nr:hypothetical protein FACS1894166_09520 [Bacilli bacterium]